MKCDTKIMIRVGIGIAAVLVIAYFTVPAAHAWVVASAPLLVSLICPLSMIFMMKGMNHSCDREHVKERDKEGDERTEKPVALPAADKATVSGR